MHTDSESILESLKQPEYIGENRCTPCTVLNVAISTALSIAIWKRSRVAGVLTGLATVGAISIRGYVIPGTPTFTKRYLPETILQLLGKPSDSVAVESMGLSGQQATAEIDLERLLMDAEILESSPSDDDLRLCPTFKMQWRANIEQTEMDSMTAQNIAEVFGLRSGDYSLQKTDEFVALRRGGKIVGRWPSEAALMVDFAAAQLLPDWINQWTMFNSSQCGKILNGLRIFASSCPSGESVELSVETVESCCSEQDIVAAECPQTGERLFELPAPQ